MRKGVIIIISILLICTLSVSALAITYLYPNYGFEKSDMMVIAHRGFSSEAPENTKAAFTLAGKYGFHGVECDILPTMDGKWVIMHDDTVDRTTSGTGNVTDLTYDEIRRLKIDGGNNLKNYPDEIVPSLEEYLDICKSYHMCAFIELKTSPNKTDLESFRNILNSYGRSVDITVISFDKNALLSVRDSLPALKTMLIVSSLAKADIDFLVENGIYGLDYKYSAADEAILSYAKKKGLVLASWTVDTVEDAEKQYSLGTGIITTNTLVPSSEKTTSVFSFIASFLQQILTLIKKILSIFG